MKKNKIFLLILTFMALNLNLPANSFMISNQSEEIESEELHEEGIFMMDIFDIIIRMINGPTGIFSHIEKNDSKKVALFIEKNKNINKKINLTNNINDRYMIYEPCYKEYNGSRVQTTPLLFAINREKDKLALLFLSAEAIDTNKPDNLGSTPMHKACFHKNLNIIKKLLEKDANINAEDSIGDTPLICCIYCLQNQKISDSDLENVIKIIKLLTFNLATINDKTIELANELKAKYPKILEYLTLIKEYNDTNNESKVNNSQINFINKIEAEKKDEFGSLLQFFLYRSIIEIENSHKPKIIEKGEENRRPEIKETFKCRSFESTNFYKYYITNKNKEKIEHLLSPSGHKTDNLQEFILMAAEKNDLDYNKTLWTKFVLGSKMLKNTKYSDCRINC